MRMHVNPELGLIFTNTAPASVEIIVAAGDTTVHNQQQDNPSNPGVPIEKTGTGDLISLNSIYTGTTTVSEGRWFAMGPLGTAENTAINIANGATLGGPGPFTGAVQNNGTLAPSAGGITAGNISIPVGTITTINGTVNQTSTGTIRINCTPIISDKIRIIGAASFQAGSAIQIIPLPGYYPSTPTNYTIIDWDSYSGTPTVISTNANVTVTASYSNSGLSISLVGLTQNAPVTDVSGVPTTNISGFTTISGSSVNVQENSTIANTTPGSQTIDIPLTLPTVSTINTTTDATTIIARPISSAAGTALNVTGSGKTTFSADNSATLQGDINISSSTAEITDGANLGSGAINLLGTDPAVIMGDVVLPNPISATVASTFTSNATEKAVLKGAITGNGPLTFNGTGMTEIGGTDATYSSPFSGTLYSTAGHLKLNSNVSSANVNVASGAILSGVGTMKDLVLSSGSVFKPGNSIGTAYVTGSYTALAGAIYTVEINNRGESSRTVVTGNIDLQGTHIINILMRNDNGGAYPTTPIKFNILETIGASSTLTINNFELRFVPQTGLTFKIGKLNEPESANHQKALILNYENTDAAINIAATQTEANLPVPGIITTPADIAITPTDIVSPDSGLRDATVAPISPQAELTSIVFQSNSNDITSAATADAFRFKSFSSGMTPSVSGKKNTMEALLTALSKNGPVSYKRNETRLWVTPFVNRSRTNRTSSDLGSQGWSGGSLVGLEQRDKKNTWSLGILAGLMGSRSHIIGSPDTSSKTNGVLFGAFNTYKYTKKWGHEILASHTTTFIDSQRYGLDSTDKKTPFYALSNYKSTTDVINAQINYLFNIIKKKITCRLNTGITYVGSQTGKITERNAGTNGLTTDTSKNSSAELYSGIGVRRIWSVDKITIRTTAVYEYGYQMTSTGPATRTTTHSVVPKTFITPTGPRQNKHYVQFNSSYLNRDTGLKFILSYSGTLYKNVRNHTGMAKVEYRF